jgi:LuxR family quorum-sensing system transcriptional regulator SolR
MKNITLQNQSLLLAEEVNLLCSPLFKKLGINGFSYSRIFLDGSRSELWSNADALCHTFLRKKYIADTYTPENYQNDERYVLLANKIENSSSEIKKKYENQLLDQKNLFNHDNCFMIVNKNETICEYFIFYTPIGFKSAINFYFNNLNTLENFSMEFKDKAKLFIKAVDNEKIVKPWRVASTNNHNIILPIHYSDLDVTKKTCYLTKRESQIAIHIPQGRTAKEIAEILNISMRTVESHIENIKDKYLCNRKADLIVKLLNTNFTSKNLYDSK